MNTRGAPLRIALFGLFGVGNIGNEASLASAIAAVRRTSPASDLVVLGGRPDEVADEHGVAAESIQMAGPLTIDTLPRPARIALRPIVEVARWITGIRFARSVDGIVVPGTGILDDFGVRPHQMPYDLFRWSVSARLAHRPLAMIGIGAGPIDHPASRWLMRQTVRNATWVSYRDEVSHRFMLGIGAPEPEGGVHLDVAFSLERPDLVERQPGEPLRVGLGVMSYFGWANDPHRGDATLDRYVDSITTVADGLLDDGHTLRVLVGEHTDQQAVDRVVAELVRRRGSSVEQALVVEPIADFRDLLDQVARTDLVVATRYHNVVAALMMARPTVSIGYAAKNAALMSHFGLGEYCHQIDDFDPALVLDDARALAARLDDVVADARRIADRSQTEVRSRIEAVVSDIADPGAQERQP